MSKLKIAFYGDGEWAVNSLNILLSRNDVLIKKAYLRYPNYDDKLKALCIENNIEFLILKDINQELKSTNDLFDLGISVSFDQIFNLDAINAHKLGIINCHAGELPDYKGRNILNWALINNNSHFAVTAHFVDLKVDTGDIIFQEKVAIEDNDDYCSLLKKSFAICPKVVNNALEIIINNRAKPIKQSNIKAYPIYCSRRKLGDELINWNHDSLAIYNFIRALVAPGPFAQSKIKGNIVFIKKAIFLKDAPKYIDIPGSILRKDDNGLLVKTGDSYLIINEWECDILIRVGDRFFNGSNNC